MEELTLDVYKQLRAEVRPKALYTHIDKSGKSI